MARFNRGAQIAAQLSQNAVTAPAVPAIDFTQLLNSYQSGADWAKNQQDAEKRRQQQLETEGFLQEYRNALDSGNTEAANTILAKVNPELGWKMQNAILDRNLKERELEANNQYRNALLNAAQMKQQNSALNEDDKKIIAGSIKLPETITNLEEAANYSDKGYVSSGLAGRLEQGIGYAFGKNSRENMKKAENLVKTVILPELKTMFGSNPTEGERAEALALAGIDPTLSPETRRENLKNLKKMLINQNNANIQARNLQAFVKPYEVPIDGSETILQENLQQGGAIPGLREAVKKLKTGGKVQKVGNFNVEVL